MLSALIKQKIFEALNKGDLETLYHFFILKFFEHCINAEDIKILFENQDEAIKTFVKVYKFAKQHLKEKDSIFYRNFQEFYNRLNKDVSTKIHEAISTSN